MAVIGSDCANPERTPRGNPGAQCRDLGSGAVRARCTSGILSLDASVAHTRAPANLPFSIGAAAFARDTGGTPGQRSPRGMLARGNTMPRASLSGRSSGSLAHRADGSRRWSRREPRRLDAQQAPYACEAATQRSQGVWNTATQSHDGGAWGGLPAVPSFNRVAGALSGLRVLVVEDDTDIRELLIAVLADAGAVVESAESAAAGLNAVCCFQPQLLVSDIGMPGEDGYSFIRRVRALGAHAGGNIPSIALTAFSSATDREKALGAGFTLHLSKPIDPVDLVCAVKKLAQGRAG